MKSCIYEGVVRHRRLVPIEHAFRYRLFMMYLELGELPRLFDGRWFWSVEGRRLARFRRADHMKETSAGRDVPLDEAVRLLVEQRLGRRTTGPIRLLTHLEYFRFRINPVSFYFCFDETGGRLDTIIAEINNTPWGEQHCYVLDAGREADHEAVRRFQFEKAFHVSPFMEMAMDYVWLFTDPQCRLSIHMSNHECGRRVFDATMVLKRREITTASLALVLTRYPFMTARVVTGIYWQAFRLWMKGCRFFSHPAKRAIATSGGSELS